uniref:Protein kinase domain-containing protein n=1 Tax=Labrus bergylta TaxID=56723 RepID=A0A3Q3LC65_9LABR
MSLNYIVEKLISKGSFARVAKCVKTSTKEKVAVKMTKIESEEEKQDGTLQKLRAFDPDTWHFVKWDSSFIYKGHLCQEFELLDISLKDYINRRPNPSFSLKEIRHILFQVATTLQLLKNLGIAHTRLNPENIMLVDWVQQQLTVKVIGFGAACEVSKGEQGPCIQPKFYRAPETMLGLPCNEATDMWALGSIAVELLLGHVLYPGCSDYEMLWFITQTQGQLPGDIINAGLKTSQFYSMTWPNIWKLKTPDEYGYPKADQEHIVDLVKQMLQLDPCQRITPSEMLGHPFFTVSHQVDFCSSSEQREAVSESGSSSSKSNSRSLSPQDQWPVLEENKPSLVDAESVKDNSEQLPVPDDQPIIRPSSPAQSLQQSLHQLSVSEEDDSSLDHTEPLNKKKSTFDEILQKCNKGKESISPKRKKIEILEGRFLRKRPYEDISEGTKEIPETSSPEKKRFTLTRDAKQEKTKLPSTPNEDPSTVTQTGCKKRQWRALGSTSNHTSQPLKRVQLER